MGVAKRVLVVDDDDLTSLVLVRILRSEGYDVEVAPTVTTALASLARAVPDLVLLDVLLGGEDGLDLLSQIREAHDIPVIMVTGMGDEQDRVLGLRLGADDYIVKPFSYNELAARVEAVLRRTGRPEARAVQRFGRLTLDTSAREVRLDGKLVETTAKEFDLIAFLAASPRQVYSRGQLLDHVWGSSADWQDPSTVTEHVRRVRAKLSEDGGPDWIVTVRGVGYRFDPEPA